MSSQSFPMTEANPTRKEANPTRKEENPTKKRGRPKGSKSKGRSKTIVPVTGKTQTDQMFNLKQVQLVGHWKVRGDHCTICTRPLSGE